MTGGPDPSSWVVPVRPRRLHANGSAARVVEPAFSIFGLGKIAPNPGTESRHLRRSSLTAILARRLEVALADEMHNTDFEVAWAPSSQKVKR